MTWRLAMSNDWRLAMFRKSWLALLLLPFLLTACGLGSKTSLGELTLATAIDEQNRPQDSVSVISFDTPVVYLTGEVTRANAATKIAVYFRKQDGTILATYSLVGRRSKTSPYDFVGEVTYKEPNFFAVPLMRPDEGWLRGNFVAEAWLKGALSGQVTFEVKSAQEAKQANLVTKIKEVSVGEGLDESGRVIDAQGLSRFSERFYLMVVYRGVKPSLHLSSQWSYLSGGQELAKFDTLIEGEGSHTFDLSLQSFKKSFAGGFWPVGVYRVKILLDNVVVRTVDFTVD